MPGAQAAGLSDPARVAGPGTEARELLTVPPARARRPEDHIHQRFFHAVHLSSTQCEAPPKCERFFRRTDLKFKRPALRALAQPVIEQHQRHHRLDDRHRARDHARVVPPAPHQLRRRARFIHGGLQLQGNECEII